MECTKLYNQFLLELEKIYDKGEAKAITHLIFKEEGLFHNGLFNDQHTQLNITNQKRLLHYLEDLKKHTPVQYVLGHAWFHNLKFTVTPDTLIPRPETEELVQQAIEFLKDWDAPKVIDIGCDSGCIPITLKKKLPHTHVEAIDISEKALEVARKNAIMHQVSIHFSCMDFLNQSKWVFTGKYDCIISNPPYIPQSQIINMDKNVHLHEPHIALFVPDEKPLLFYEQIALFAKDFLSENGIGFVEIQDHFAKNVVALFENNGFKARSVNDLFNNSRFVHFTHCR